MIGQELTPALSAEQKEVVDQIVDWRENCTREKPTFTLGGLAGTGKSVIVANLARLLPNCVVVCPTGKAANVLQCKGVDATTVHSLIYNVIGRARFRLKRHLDAATIIVDEASMVDAKLYGDLCSFSTPILFVGDHGQLEPLGENPHLMANPDLRLEIIYRQACDNPIIRLGAAFREGREDQVWAAMRGGIWQDKTGRCTVTTRAHLNDYLYSGMQVIVGLNKARHELNSRIRSQLGFKGRPSPGDKVICLKNNARFGLFNGQQCVVIGVGDARHGIVELELETDDGRRITAPCLSRQFSADAIKDHGDVAVLLVDFGYVLTAHKAQGSEYGGVLVLEQIWSEWDAKRWRYTATTRAKERIVYCR